MQTGDFKNVLAIDTSVNGCSVAVLAGGRFVSRVRPMERGHAEHLVPMIGEVMQECGLSYDDLDAIAVTLGPGAFTGIRVGLSAAQALGLSLSIPVFGLSTMQALALSFVRQKKENCVVAIDTKRGDFYAGRFDAQGMAVGAPQVVSEGGILTLAAAMLDGGVVIGDGAEFLQDFSLPVVRGFELPDVCLMAALASEEKSRKIFFSADPEPIYLRDADVSHSTTKHRMLVGE